MKITTIRNLIFVLAIALVGVACSDSSTGSNADPAEVDGRVDNTSSESQKALFKSVEGAVVTAARVNAQGELQTIGSNEATTNAQGEFTLQIDAEAVANTSDDIVVVAEKDGESAKTFVTAEVQSGSSVEVQPITFESSSETEVYQEVIANGDAEIVAKADIEASVNTEVATDIESSTSTAAEVAAALAARAEARADYYSQQGVEISEEQMSTIKQTKTQAQIQLESELNAATSAEAKQAAWDSFVETVATAETEANVQASAATKASESSGRVLLKNTTSLSTEAQAELRKHVAYMSTFTLETAVKAQMQAAGATESSVNSAANVCATLRADIKAMSNAAEEDVEAAYVTFNDEIEAIVESDSELNGELFVSANSQIKSDQGAKSSFESSLEGTLQWSLIMDAYTSFHSDIQGVVESTFSGASDAKVQAYTELLVLINLSN